MKVETLRAIHTEKEKFYTTQRLFWAHLFWDVFWDTKRGWVRQVLNFINWRVFVLFVKNHASQYVEKQKANSLRIIAKYLTNNFCLIELFFCLEIRLAQILEFFFRHSHSSKNCFCNNNVKQQTSWAGFTLDMDTRIHSIDSIKFWKKKPNRTEPFIIYFRFKNDESPSRWFRINFKMLSCRHSIVLRVRG